MSGARLTSLCLPMTAVLFVRSFDEGDARGISVEMDGR